MIKAKIKSNAAQPKTSDENSSNGSEVAQLLAPLHLEKTFKKPKRSLSRSHADYWKSRLFRRSYKHEGTQHQVNDLYVRIQHGGRREFFPLQTTNQDAAAVRARDIYNFIKANGWQPTFAKFKPDADGQPKFNVTVGEYLAAVERTGRLRARTFDNYRRCLRTIVAETFGIRLAENESKYDYRSGGQATWAQRVDEIRLERITLDRLNKWKRERIVSVGHVPNAQASARRTVNSYIRCARSFFTSAVIRELKNLQLPTPLPFHGIELEEAGSQKYVSKINVQSLIVEAKKELKIADIEAYKAFMLGLFAGMRKAEIDSVEWRMLDYNLNLIRLEETEWLQLKTADSAATIPVDPEVMSELQMLKPASQSALLSQSQFVLNSSRPPRANSLRAFYRAEQTFDRLNVWLRGKGIRSNKPLHELRKEVGAVLSTELGIYAASKFLRHSDITTTARHYADQKARINVGLGKFLN